MTTKEIRAEWCKIKGFNYIDFDTLKEAEEYILFLESKLELKKEFSNQNKKKITKEEASRKIVEYFNQHQMVGGKWDSIMYTQKKFVMELLNQNKDE